MAVRSAMPWPLRWVVLAVVFGFCAALGLWAFEFGKNIAGLDNGSRQALQLARSQMLELKTEVQTLKEERNQAQSIANTAGTLMTSETVAQEKLALQVKQLALENQGLRSDMAVFEKLVLSCQRKS
jgi:hypothetical protein